MIKNLIVKASLFTLILAFIVTGTVAIAAVMKRNGEQAKEVEKVLLIKTWYFNGSHSPTNVVDANLYDESQLTEKDCGIPQTVCTINAPEDLLNPGHPKMDALVNASQTVADQIKEALENHDPNDTVTEFREF